MQFISMDLIGEFHLKSSAGNSYVVTVTGMLTGYTFYITNKFRSVPNINRAYIDHVYAKLSGSILILSDNRTGITYNFLLHEKAFGCGTQDLYDLLSSLVS